MKEHILDPLAKVSEMLKNTKKISAEYAETKNDYDWAHGRNEAKKEVIYIYYSTSNSFLDA